MAGGYDNEDRAAEVEEFRLQQERERARQRARQDEFHRPRADSAHQPGTKVRGPPPGEAAERADGEPAPGGRSEE